MRTVTPEQGLLIIATMPATWVVAGLAAVVLLLTWRAER
jgi:hypothetical protein